MNRLLNAKSLLSDIYTIKVLNVQLAVEGDRGQTINENKIMITKVGMYGGTTVQYVTKNDLFQDCINYIKRRGFIPSLVENEFGDNIVYLNLRLSLDGKKNYYYEKSIIGEDFISALLSTCEIIRKGEEVNARDF